MRCKLNHINILVNFVKLLVKFIKNNVKCEYADSDCVEKYEKPVQHVALDADISLVSNEYKVNIM